MTLPNSALILVDCQNEFLSADGKLYEAVKPSLDKNDVIPNINQVLDAAHATKIPVIFTSMVFSEGYPEMGETPYGILHSVKGSGGFIRGSWGAQIAECLNFNEHDIVVEKSQMCAFKKTQLLDILKERHIQTLYFGGLVTDLCLETSARSAYDYGYEAYTLTDCMAALSLDAHENSVKENFPLFSKPIHHLDFLKKISGQQNAA